MPRQTDKPALPKPFQLQEGDWVCKHCGRLLVTADRVVSDIIVQTSHDEAFENPAAQHGVIVVRPQRWMRGSMAAADESAELLCCPK